MNCKSKHRFTLQHLLRIKIVVFLSNNLRIWYAECCHQPILDPSDSECLRRKSVKYLEKWNESGKEKSLTTGIQEMRQDDFILEKITSKF